MGLSISVVIPVKNRPALVARAVESCLAQTRPPDQIVVADDGSTDETPSVLRDLARRVPSLTLVERPASGGAAVARNDAAAAARGTYLAFLDSDDTWDATKLEKQAALAASHPEAPGIFCGVRYAYAERAPRDGIPPPRVTLADLRTANRLAGASTGLVRREVFQTLGGFDATLPNCEDWDLWLRLAARGDLLVVQEPLVRYSFEADNKLSRDEEKLLRGHEMVFDKVARDLGEGSEASYVAAMHDLTRAELHIRITGRVGRALGHIGRALGRRPSPAVVGRAVRLVGLAATHGRRT